MSQLAGQGRAERAAWVAHEREAHEKSQFVEPPPVRLPWCPRAIQPAADWSTPLAVQLPWQYRACPKWAGAAQTGCGFVYRGQWCLTPRSSRAPTACHAGPAGGTRYIFATRARASHRWCRLNSNVRRQMAPTSLRTSRNILASSRARYSEKVASAWHQLCRR